MDEKTQQTKFTDSYPGVDLTKLKDLTGISKDATLQDVYNKAMSVSKEEQKTHWDPKQHKLRNGCNPEHEPCDIEFKSFDVAFDHFMVCNGGQCRKEVGPKGSRGKVERPMYQDLVFSYVACNKPCFIIDSLLCEAYICDMDDSLYAWICQDGHVVFARFSGTMFVDCTPEEYMRMRNCEQALLDAENESAEVQRKLLNEAYRVAHRWSGTSEEEIERLEQARAARNSDDEMSELQDGLVPEKTM